MRKIVLNVAVSLDGYIEGPNGEYDWCFTDQDYGFTDFMNRVDTIFYGRKSYELFGSYGSAADASEAEKEVFNSMSEKKKYVFSKTVDSINDTVIIKDNIAEEVNKIKQMPGKDIYFFGGASLLSSFMNLNLIDEYVLGLHPIVLGAGKPLFINIHQRNKLKLTGTKVYSSGLVLLKYINE